MQSNFFRAALAATIFLSPAAVSAPEQHSGDMQTHCDAMAGDDTASVTLEGLTVENAFARATLPNAPVGGGYLSITNTNDADDSLLSATSSAAGEVQLHEMSMVDDVMRMNELPDGITIPAGETVTLAPGGLHLMFMQLTQSFDEGSTVPVTLSFEKAGTVEVMLDVRGIAAGTGADCNGAMEMEGHHGE